MEGHSYEEKKCAVCDNAIEGKILTAMGKTYHPEHFTCAKCNEPIKNTKFQTHEGLPYCEKDYAKYHLKRCSYCKEPITDKIIRALDADWHEEHFFCHECKKKLAGTSFMAKDNNPFCENCYHNKFADRCKGCEKPITDQAIIAMNEKWHAGCFKCQKCKKPVEDDTFQVSKGKPICGKCT